MPDVRPLTDDELPRAISLLTHLRDHLEVDRFLPAVLRQRRAGYRLAGAFIGPALVGVIGVRAVETLARGPHLHVDDLAVRPEHRGQGVGEALIAWAEDEARALGCVALFLDSRPDAIAVYERLGFAAHAAVSLRKGVSG